MLKIALSNINNLYRAISAEFPLYLPIEKAGEVNYAYYEEDATVRLDVLKTVKSPKDAFFPQNEDLVKFKIEGQKIEVIDVREQAKPFVIMGVRACDYKAFDVLDRVFLVDPLDTYYATKRQAGIIITHACGKVEESCFCKTFGIDPVNPLGDVTVWTDSENLYWRANTQKGEDLTQKLSGLFTDGGEEEVAKEQAQVNEIYSKLPLASLTTEAFKNGDMMELFNSDKWQKLSEACIGCGTCTFVCPTCQCFDIREFVTNSGVTRFRCWDSCMCSDFTKTAGGQPRTTQMQRYRQRFMHKLVYYPQNNEGIYSCVGCGRCVKKCPQGLNIVKVLKEFGGKKDA